MSAKIATKAEAEAIIARADRAFAEMHIAEAEARQAVATARAAGYDVPGLGNPFAEYAKSLRGSAPVVTLAPRRPAVSHVYAIRFGTDGPIKIGRAVKPSDRLADLQCANHETLTMLGAVPETAQLNERSEHRRLADRRLRGEWFDITPADLPWLESL